MSDISIEDICKIIRILNRPNITYLKAHIDSNNKNRLHIIGEIMPDDIDWNECLPFTGPESQLPTGVAHLPKGISVLDMLKEGSVKKTKSGGILSLEIDNDVYDQLVETYGSGQILIATAGGHGITRETWYEQFGQSDGLRLAIIRELNKKNPGEKPFEIP